MTLLDYPMCVMSTLTGGARGFILICSRRRRLIDIVATIEKFQHLMISRGE
jgi:hypothetical protein